MALATSVILAGILWIDRVFAFQFMLSRPIVLAPLLGALTGNLAVGLIIGASIELLWLNAPPVGAYLPYDDTFSAAVAVPVGVCSLAVLGDEASACGFALALSLPTALIGRSLDMHLRRRNETLIVCEGSQSGASIRRAMATALARALAEAILAIGACVGLLCLAVSFLAPLLPVGARTALSYLPFVCIITGLAGLYRREGPVVTHLITFLLGVSLILVVTWCL